MFTDIATIKVSSGDGGDGIVAFNKQPFDPRGSACGGNGGTGGSVCFIGDSHVEDLSGVSYKRGFVAQKGGNGGKKDKTGRNGEDMHIQVPPGTVVYEVEEDKSKRKLFEIEKHAQEEIVVRGAKGGRGNRSYQSATNQTPKLAEAGHTGREMKLLLDLRIISDACLIGAPNSGKSHLLSCLTNAKPEVSSRPFTTITPVKGSISDERYNFCLVELPAIPQATRAGNSGIKHLVNTKLHIYVLDGESEDPHKQLKALTKAKRDFENLNGEQLNQPTLTVLTKVDDEDIHLEKLPEDTMAVSAKTGYGLENLSNRIIEMLSEPDVQSRKNEAENGEPYVHSPLPEDNPKETVVREDSETFRITHPYAVRIARGSNLDDYEALLQYRAKIGELKLDRALELQGIRSGNVVNVDRWSFTWG